MASPQPNQSSSGVVLHICAHRGSQTLPQTIARLEYPMQSGRGEPPHLSPVSTALQSADRSPNPRLLALGLGQAVMRRPGLPSKGCRYHRLHDLHLGLPLCSKILMRHLHRRAALLKSAADFHQHFSLNSAADFHQRLLLNSAAYFQQRLLLNSAADVHRCLSDSSHQSHCWE